MVKKDAIPNPPPREGGFVNQDGRYWGATLPARHFDKDMSDQIRLLKKNPSLLQIHSLKAIISIHASEDTVLDNTALENAQQKADMAQFDHFEACIEADQRFMLNLKCRAEAWDMKTETALITYHEDATIYGTCCK